MEGARLKGIPAMLALPTLKILCPINLRIYKYNSKTVQNTWGTTPNPRKGKKICKTETPAYYNIHYKIVTFD